MDIQNFENSFLYKAFLVDGWEINNYYKNVHVPNHNDYLEVEISKISENSNLKFHARLSLDDIKVDSREEASTYWPKNQIEIINQVNEFYDVFDQYSDNVVKAIIKNNAQGMTISNKDLDEISDDHILFGSNPIENVDNDCPVIAYIDTVEDNHNYCFNHSTYDIINDVSNMKDCFMDISKVMDASIDHDFKQLRGIENAKNEKDTYYSKLLNKVENMQPIAVYETEEKAMFFDDMIKEKITFFDISKKNITCSAQVGNHSYPIETFPAKFVSNKKENLLVSEALSNCCRVFYTIPVNDIKMIDKDSCLDKLTNLKEDVSKKSKDNSQKKERSISSANKNKGIGDD